MLDQATQALMDQLAAVWRPMQELTPQEARAFTAALSGGAAEPGLPAGVSARRALIEVSGGAIPATVLVPEGPVRGVIVYFPGGGWVQCTAASAVPAAAELAAATGCAVVVVEYRVAPEHRFPTAVDDAYAALQWAAERVHEIAGHSVPLIVAGDSAGGNLAAVVAARSVDRHGPEVAAQVLVYPVTNCDLDTHSYRDPENQLLLTREMARWFWDHYVPVEADRLHPDASPLQRANVAGLPPAIVVTAEHDVLRDEGELYATRLMRARVPVRHRRFPGQMHGFFTMPDVLPAARDAIAYIAGALQDVLAAEDVPVG